MNELALFAGIGGGLLGGMLLGWETICAVEIDKYAASVLLQWQNDGFLPPFPIWDDIRTFDGKPWRGLVDVVSGGFPCQDISAAGKGVGINGERSGLWKEMARVIHDVRPKYAFMENSPMLTIRGLGQVLGDLAEMGYDAEWCVLGASDVGAPHIRKRIWILAYIAGMRWRERNENPNGICEREGTPGERNRFTDSSTVLSNANSERFKEQWEPKPSATQFAESQQCDWWSIEPDVGRVAHGIPFRVDRLKGLGNAQVPVVAATAWNVLIERIKK